MPLVFCPVCGEVDSDDPTLDADQVGEVECFDCWNEIMEPKS